MLGSEWLCLAAGAARSIYLLPWRPVLSCLSVQPCNLPACLQGQLLDELDTEIAGTSTRIAAAQVSRPCLPGTWHVTAKLACCPAWQLLLVVQWSRAAAPLAAGTERSPAAPALPALPCLQKKVEYVLQKAGAKGQMAIIGFLILTLVILIVLLVAG